MQANSMSQIHQKQAQICRSHYYWIVRLAICRICYALGPGLKHFINPKLCLYITNPLRQWYSTGLCNLLTMMANWLDLQMNLSMITLRNFYSKMHRISLYLSMIESISNKSHQSITQTYIAWAGRHQTIKAVSI